MKPRTHEVLNPPKAERAVLVGHAGRDGHDLPRSLEELRRLADTAGARVLGELVQRRGGVHPPTFLGKGKLADLKSLVGELQADLVLFNDDLSPSQVRNLEKELEAKVVDRSELILDIFARRARSRESRLQVELAQLQYTLPRLTGMWRHLERQTGGIGMRGPGETQLETDRRLVREKIARLKLALESVERERETQRRRRRDHFRAALGRLPELQHTEPAVAVVHAQQGHARQAQVRIDAPRQRIRLHAVVLNGGEIPRDDGFRNGGIGGGRVHDRHLGLEADA